MYFTGFSLLLELGAATQICEALPILVGTTVILLVDVFGVGTVLTNNPVCC